MVTFNNSGFLKCVNVKESFDVFMVNTTVLYFTSANNVKHMLYTWLNKDYRSIGYV